MKLWWPIQKRKSHGFWPESPGFLSEKISLQISSFQTVLADALNILAREILYPGYANFSFLTITKSKQIM